MAAWLRSLGIVVMALGVGTSFWAATRVAGDFEFAEIAARYERHSDNVLFQAEYYPAAVRHYGLIVAAIGGVLGGLVFGSLLLGIATLLARPVDRLRAPETQKAG